jgi:hypothetical protein
MKWSLGHNHAYKIVFSVLASATLLRVATDFLVTIHGGSKGSIKGAHLTT